MAKFNVRDILGHFVKPPREGMMCPHPCCRNKRPHPAGLPVMLSARQVRHLPEDVLVAHADSDRVRDSPAAFKAITRELTRRENVQAARNRRRGKSDNYREYLEAEWVNAETATNGYMLNRRGLARGIDPRSLWTANDRTRAAYASDELRQYWAKHPPVTRAEHDHGRTAAKRHRLYDIY